MRFERMGAASGAVYVLAIMIGNGLYESGSSGGDDGPGMLADLQRETTMVHSVGLTLEVLGFTAFLVFLGYLYRVLRCAEGPDGWLASTALGAGLVTVAIKLGSIAPVMAADLRSQELTPDLVRTLMDLGGAAFVVSGYSSGIFVAAAAAATLTGRVLPRWLALAGVAVGVLTVAAGAAGVLDPASYVPLPFLFGLLWLLVTSAVLTVRGSNPPAIGTQSAAMPMGAAAGS